MSIWHPDESALSRPIYRSLVNHLARTIESGAVRPGTRLPTHRKLARDLRISAQTVARAYEELIRRGLASAQVGRGTFARGAGDGPAPPFIPERGEGGLIDLSMLKPVSGPLHVEAARQALGRLQDDMPSRLLFSFRPNVALRTHKEAAVEWLALCGLQVRPNDVHITGGATPAMTIALMTVLQPGDLMVTEGVGHHTLVPLARYLGARLLGLAIDDQGVIPAAFDEACRAHKVRALFLVPTVANPTVALMGESRRQAIAEIARRHDVWIVENEAWGPLVERRPPPIASLVPERTFFVTSFTKCVMPALRIGYLVAPEQLMAAVANRHLVTNWMASALLSEMAARWVRDGTARDLVQWQREALRKRQALACELLGAERIRSHPEGLHVWLPLPGAWGEDDLVAHARLQGVAVAPGASFVTSPAHQVAAVRLCIGAPSETELREGLSVVARLLQGEPEPVLLTI